MAMASLDTEGFLVRFGDRQLAVARFPDRMTQFLHGNPATPRIEEKGRELIAHGFPPDEVQTFVHSVCRWGGSTGNRVWGQVRKNEPELVANALKQATAAMNSRELPLTIAMHCVNQVKGLGAVSYASKVLRFLSPERCATLDSLLAQDFGVPATPESFAIWSDECAAIARRFNSAGLCTPPPHSTQWRAADIEAAIFTELHPEVVSSA